MFDKEEGYDQKIKQKSLGENVLGATWNEPRTEEQGLKWNKENYESRKW